MIEHNKKETRNYFKRKEIDKLNGVLSQWYGSQRAACEIVSKLPQPTAISDCIDQVLKKQFKPGDKKLMDVKANWTTLVGNQIAEISHPVKMYGGVIYVEVIHNAWLRELQGGTKKLILRNINKFCGETFCKDIRFTPAGRGK